MSEKASGPNVLEKLRACLPGILQGRPVVLAYVYGSTVEGYTTLFSDVDIALVLAPDCPLDAYDRFMMELDIAAELERDCGIRNADVRSLDDAPLRVQGQVLTRGVLVYSTDEDFRVEYEVSTRKRYFDFQPVLALMSGAYFGRLEADLKEKGLY